MSLNLFMNLEDDHAQQNTANRCWTTKLNQTVESLMAIRRDPRALPVGICDDEE